MGNYVLDKLDELDNILDKYVGEPCSKNTLKTRYSYKVNYLKITDEKDINDWNNMINILKELVDLGQAKKASLTKKGHISKQKYYPISYYVDISYVYCAELWVLTDNLYRFQVGHGRDNRVSLSGKNCFDIFAKRCDDYGINIEDYAVEDDTTEVPSPPRDVYNHYIGVELEHCYHIDINSSYPNGLVKTHPEFEGVIKSIYEDKINSSGKEKAKYKAVLNYTIGMFYSRKLHRRYAQLARDAIGYNNKMIEDLVNTLTDLGYLVVCTNTDGVWFKPTKFSELLRLDFGNDLGQLKLDHQDCTCYFRSANCYQFIEDDVVYTKMSGLSRLDSIKPRDCDGKGWNWRDIDTFDSIPCYMNINEDGIIKGEHYEKD